MVAAADGSAVAQATVIAVDSDGVAFTATTDSSGAYTIGNLHPGGYTLTVQADGFATATTTAVIAQAGSTTVEPAVSLAAPASMTVTLQDSTSTPIASVAVDLVQDGVVVAEGETDATGTVTLTGLAAGRYEVQTQAFPFLSPDAFVTAQSGASLTETYVLQAGGTIQGAVTDGSGQPLADVPVTVLSPDGTGLPAATASDGTYQFVGLDVGTYAVMIGTISGLERQEVSLAHPIRTRP